MDEDGDTRAAIGGDDPRVQDEHVRTVTASEGRASVVLVGVVHDHPASNYRARSVVEAVAPDVLALELPALAVPLFERFAGESTATGPGGEMSSAVRGARSAGTERVVGIDMPSLPYARALTRVLREQSPSLGALRGVATETLSVTAHAVRCRVAAVTGGPGPRPSPVDPAVFDAAATAPPADQADHESAHLARSRSLLGALEPPAAVRLTDEARERAMARRLDDLRKNGTVVAVVGFDHLDAVARSVGARADGR